jgi:hypothetical protein
MVAQASFPYQWLVLGLVVGIGLILVFIRPYFAYLCSIFIPLACGTFVVLVTRTEELGPYFNLYDACLLVAIMAFVVDTKPKISLPRPALAIIVVLTIGLVTSIIHLGIAYGVFRALRWAITLPLQFILAANLVYNEKRVRSLLLTLFLAAIVAEFQHILIIMRLSQEVGERADLMRTGAFTMAASWSWLMAGPFLVNGKAPRPWLQIGAGALFLLAMISVQGRAMVLAFMGGAVVYYFWFLKGPNACRWQRFKKVFLVFTMVAVVMAATGLTMLATGLQERMTSTFNTKESMADRGIENRYMIITTQLNDWLDGNILTGRGLDYFEIYARKLGGEARGLIDWGTMTYVAYLSQLGLLGLFVYGVYFPLAVIFRARGITKTPEVSPVILYLALLGGGCFIMQYFNFIFSNSYLGQQYIPGILAGAVWAVPRAELKKGTLAANNGRSGGNL